MISLAKASYPNGHKNDMHMILAHGCGIRGIFKTVPRVQTASNRLHVLKGSSL